MRLHPLSAAALAALLAPSAAAQVEGYSIAGAAPGDRLGTSLAAAGDVDGDGAPDWVVGARYAQPLASNGGAALVLSGPSGQVLLSLAGEGAGDGLGTAVAGAGDIDGDQRADVIVGAPFDDDGAWNGGTVRVVSGASGQSIFTFLGGTQFGLFGSAVDGGRDLDGDGVPDIVVGAPTEDAGGIDSGAVYVFSGQSGVNFETHPGIANDERLGASVALLGDATFDGRSEVAAGAPLASPSGLTEAGLVRVWSGGGVLFVATGNEAGARLGHALCAPGDLDGDGRADLVAGAYGAAAGAGRVRAFSGATGGELWSVDGAAANEHFGAALAAIGDVDGDGIGDVLAGAPGAGIGGGARVLSGASGALLFEMLAAEPNASMGSAVGALGDLDGDGRAEWTIASPLADVAGADAGRATVWSRASLVGDAYCFGDGGGATCPCGNFGQPGQGCANSTAAGATLSASGTASVTSDDLVLTATNLVPGQPALLYAADNALAGGAGLAFGDGLRCAGGNVARLGIQSPAGGVAPFGPGLAGPAGASPGTTRRFQVWYRDPLASPCGTGFNLSSALAIDFLP